MLDERELLALLEDIESDRVERKASASDTKKICQAICAFANDLPGHGKSGLLVIGVNDDGTCSNIAITDQLLLELAGFRADGNILPPPVMSVHKTVLKGCEVAIVEVQPSTRPPVRYRGRVWVRVGPRRATATEEEEHRLVERSQAAMLPFDQQPVSGSTLEDLDLDYFTQHYLPQAVAPDVLEENRRTIEAQLRSLHFLGAGREPNYGAVIVLGRDPREWLPGAYLQFVRYDGSNLTDPVVNQKEISGRLEEAMRQLDEVLRANISVASDVKSQTTEVKYPDYPIVALEQICRNAIIHRNYYGTNTPVRIYWFSDRIEILNPGGPYGSVNRTNFGREGLTDYRNPLLAEASKVLGFVQRFGIGIPMARNELKKNGNPDLEFEVEDTFILATIRSR